MEDSVKKGRDDGLVDEPMPDGINPFDPFISEDEEDMAIRSGQFRQRVTIQEQVAGFNAFGEKSAAFSDVATVWASVVPQTGVERFAAEQEEGTVTHKVNMRFRDDVGPTNRIQFDGGRILDIQSVLDVDNRGAEIQLNCLERRIG